MSGGGKGAPQFGPFTKVKEVLAKHMGVKGGKKFLTAAGAVYADVKAKLGPKPSPEEAKNKADELLNKNPSKYIK